MCTLHTVIWPDITSQLQVTSKDILPNIDRPQAAVSVHFRHPVTPGCDGMVRLLLDDITCSVRLTRRLTMHCQWGGKPPVLTSTFDLDIQTLPSEGPSTSSLWVCRKSVQRFSICLKHKQKVTHSAKNRTVLACGNQPDRSHNALYLV